MKKLICEAPRKLKFVDAPCVTPSDDWVPIDIRAVGLCGSDYHIYNGTQPYLTYPRVMGHELSGVIGDDWNGDEFCAGQTVLIDPYLACGTCGACRLGKNNCCKDIQVLGVHCDGGMCERLFVPKSSIIDAAGLTFNQAAMVEFLSVGRHAVARTKVRPGAKVLVVGGGPIGLGAALFARLEGGNVYVADVSSSKRFILSTDFALNVLDPDPGKNELSQYGPFDHVFDATGAIGAMNKGIEYLDHGGTYTLLSVVQGDLVFHDPDFHKKETTLLASRNAQRADFQHVIDCMLSGAIDTGKLMTHRSTLESAINDIPKWTADRNEVIKAVIEVGR